MYTCSLRCDFQALLFWAPSPSILLSSLYDLISFHFICNLQLPTWFWLPISGGYCVVELFFILFCWNLSRNGQSWKPLVLSTYFWLISFNICFWFLRFLSGYSCRFVLLWKNIPPINLFLLSYHMERARCLTRHSTRRRWKGFAWLLSNRFIFQFWLS